MNYDHLVNMANQIAAYYEPYPRETAMAGITNHLQRFWAPALRTEILALPPDQETRLHPLLREALIRLR